MQRLYTANTDATGGLYPTKWKTSSGEPMNGGYTNFDVLLDFLLISRASFWLQTRSPWVPWPIVGMSTS